MVPRLGWLVVSFPPSGRTLIESHINRLLRIKNICKITLNLKLIFIPLRREKYSFKICPSFSVCSPRPDAYHPPHEFLPCAPHGPVLLNESVVSVWGRLCKEAVRTKSRKEFNKTNHTEYEKKCLEGKGQRREPQKKI